MSIRNTPYHFLFYIHQPLIVSSSGTCQLTDMCSNKRNMCYMRNISEQTFTCSRSETEALEKGNLRRSGVYIANVEPIFHLFLI